MRCGQVDYTQGKNQTCDAANEVGLSTCSDTGRWNNLNNLVSNRAAAKFVSEAQAVAQASLGETLGEWSQSLSMLTHRLKQLEEAAHYLRRDVGITGLHRAGRALGLSKDKIGRNTSERLKTFGDWWLELHLGWAPLMSDIYACMQAFERDPNPRRVQATASARDHYEVVSAFTNSITTTKVDYRVGYCVRADVKVTNPNIALLAQLGLVNPASVAWNLAPYSFVVDWFVNISELIGMYDGLLGCGHYNTSYTTLRNGQGVKENINRLNSLKPWELNTLINSRGTTMTRTLGLPPVHLTYPTSPRFSWQRGATAISLLLQLLK
jgi:hypothetical protein